MSAFYHEQLQRSEAAMQARRELPVTVCGAGALGANIAESLARQGFGRLRVIDRDRVEERNLSTQPYYRADIGAQKVKILANALYRAVGTPVEGKVAELTAANAAKLLAGSGLVIDTFDNSAARQAVQETCTTHNIPCLHAGLADGYSEILWNEGYRVPSSANDDVCDYPLARNLVMLAAAVAGETVAAFADRGDRLAWTITLADLAVSPVDGGLLAPGR